MPPSICQKLSGSRPSSITSGLCPPPASRARVSVCEAQTTGEGKRGLTRQANQPATHDGQISTPPVKVYISGQQPPPPPTHKNTFWEKAIRGPNGKVALPPPGSHAAPNQHGWRCVSHAATVGAAADAERVPGTAVVNQKHRTWSTANREGRGGGENSCVTQHNSVHKCWIPEERRSAVADSTSTAVTLRPLAGPQTWYSPTGA